MTGFLKQSSCKGHRPNHLASRRHYPRPDLIARLLRERHVARFLVAPEGFGKTGLAMEYADVVFSFDHVFWINGKSPCFLQGSFYPLSDGNPTLYHRITKSYFRTCSTRRCRSQAPFCLCTLRMVSTHSEGTFERLRYPFGGDRPSQTPHLTLSPDQFMVAG